MNVVVDAATVAAALLGDDDRVLDLLAAGTALAPPLFWSEMRALLREAERRGHLAEGEAAAALRDLHLAPPASCEDRGDDTVLALAARLELGAADAAYAALAIAADAPLATLVPALRRAAAGGAFRLWEAP